jgi:hypothetical protein
MPIGPYWYSGSQHNGLCHVWLSMRFRDPDPARARRRAKAAAAAAAATTQGRLLLQGKKHEKRAGHYKANVVGIAPGTKLLVKIKCGCKYPCTLPNTFTRSNIYFKQNQAVRARCPECRAKQ